MARKQTFWSFELESLPTLCVGQCCDLKVDTGDTRVWLCRVADGVTVEQRVGRGWEITDGSCESPSAELEPVS
jgi:hypothetical protein